MPRIGRGQGRRSEHFFPKFQDLFLGFLWLGGSRPNLSEKFFEALVQGGFLIVCPAPIIHRIADGLMFYHVVHPTLECKFSFVLPFQAVSVLWHPKGQRRQFGICYSGDQLLFDRVSDGATLDVQQRPSAGDGQAEAQQQ